jgi:rare lipoprotein A
MPGSFDGIATYNRPATRLAVLVLALAACIHAQDQPGTPAFEEGIASWYGPSFDGQRSASGEIFDSGQLTAAHRTLPFGTKVRVRRLDTAESIVVRINDRGPFVESRIIDLSYAAAQRLGGAAYGLFRVALEVLEVPEIADQPLPAVQPRLLLAVQPKLLLAVQVGTFRDPVNARRTSALMQEKFGDNVTVQRSGEFWCVLVGNAITQAEADNLAAAVRQSDAAFRSAFVVHLGQ